MKDIPDYKKYTLNELFDVYNNIDKEKFPLHTKLILSEIEERKSGKSNKFTPNIVVNKNYKTSNWLQMIGIYLMLFCNMMVLLIKPDSPSFLFMLILEIILFFIALNRYLVIPVNIRLESDILKFKSRRETKIVDIKNLIRVETKPFYPLYLVFEEINKKIYTGVQISDLGELLYNLRERNSNIEIDEKLLEESFL